MNVLILAAGYATRLYPLTLTKAKPLLEVAGKPMIEWVLDNLSPVPDIKGIFVVTNNKFAKDFQEWAGDISNAPAVASNQDHQRWVERRLRQVRSDRRH